MIKIDKLTFKYRKDPIIEDLTFSMDSGRIYGLFGKNGAGKSTLLKLLSGQLYPKAGKVRLSDLRPGSRSSHFLSQCFLLPEEPYIPSIPIDRFIELYGSFYPLFSNDDFYKLLNEFEIERGLHLGRASMGQRKKVFIAFALACNTSYILMDEPTNGLDIPSKRQFKRILSYIMREDRTFIISTHQVRDLHSIIDHVLMMDEGQIILSESIASISEHLTFSITRQSPSPDNELIYYDRVPGGYLCLSAGGSDHSLEPDIEVLFNAMMCERNAVLNSFVQ